MKTFLYILGGIFLLAGFAWIVSVTVAVANHNPDYSRFTQLIVPIVIHAACDFIGIILIGLGMRYDKTAPAEVKETARPA